MFQALRFRGDCDAILRGQDLATVIWGHCGLATQPAGMPTFARPFTRLTQKVSSSLLSSSARTQCFGGCRYRPHSCTVQEAHCFVGTMKCACRSCMNGACKQADCTASCCDFLTQPLHERPAAMW